MTRCVVILLTIVGAACTSRTGAGQGRTRLRITDTGPKDIKSLPFLMTLDELRQQGFDVEVVSVQSFDLVPDVLLHGDGEIGRISTQAAWTANAKGASLRTIVEANGTWEVVTQHDIDNCRDLDGKGAAFGSTRGVNVAMFKQFIAKHCPGSEPHLVVISNSASRAAALMTGQVAAAQLEVQDVAHLERQAPGRFRPLLQAEKEFPDVVVVAYAVREEWARDHPDAVRAFIRAFVQSQRRLIDTPQRVRDEASARLSLDDGVVQTLAEAYRSRGLWEANGGLTSARIQTSIDFLTAARALPPGLTPDRVVDLSYLNAVLDEIGRR